MPIVVSITDDHPLAIIGIVNMLKSEKNIQIGDTYSSAKELKDGLKSHLPDVLLLDILLPDSKDATLVSELIKDHPSLKIIALTSLDAPSHVKAMMRNGCKGYILKNAGQQMLIHAIKEVVEGRWFIEPQLEEEMRNNMLQFQKSQPAPKHVNKLSSREMEILQLIAEEYSNREIASKLFLSLRTVQNHFFNLQQKLQAKNAVGMVKIAIQMGLIKP